MKDILDVLFIEPDSSAKSYQGLNEVYTAIETPTWALLHAQSCRSKGFKVNIMDCRAEGLTDDQAVQRVRELNPRLVCFVIYGQNPNSGTVSMVGAIRLASKLKLEMPECLICFTGSHTSALPKEVLAYDFVDIVLLNEGVYALHNLLRSNLKDELNKVKGIGYKKDNQLILNEPEDIVPQHMMDIDLPGYAWDLLPYKNKPLDLYRAHFWHAEFNHSLRTPFASIYTSLGCPFKCVFCMINILNRSCNDDEITSADTPIMRAWSSNLILKEFDKLASFGAETIRIADEMFFLNRRYYEPLLQGLINRGYPLRMWAYSRVDTIRPDRLELFRKAGVKWFALGIEAGSQNVRYEMSKGKFKEIDIHTAVKKVQEYGINILANYILGLPDDDFQTMQQTLDLAIDLNTEYANLWTCHALPGSPLYFIAKKNRWQLPTKFEEYAFLSYDCLTLPTKYLTAAEALKFRDEAWYKYFYREEYLSLIEKKFGTEARNNILELGKIKLKRKLLGDKE
jgi:anaerobic magnesium-protoporphyrin IX monomethyl ester cyclase